MERNPLSERLSSQFTAFADSRPDATILKMLEGVRARCRKAAGGGDCDRQVALECCAMMGWRMASLTYLFEGEVVACKHHVCVLKDGTIVDPTRDQFGDGPAIRIVRPADEDYRRYRSEFRLGNEPGHVAERTLANKEALFTRSKWDGTHDEEAEEELVEERGHDWWVSPQRQEDLRAYLEEVVASRSDATTDDHKLEAECLRESMIRPRPDAEERLAAMESGLRAKGS